MDLFASDHPGPDTGDSTAAEPGPLPPPARAPRAGAMSLDDWPRSGGTRLRPWLVVAATLPWVVVAAILLGGPRSQPTPAPAPSMVPTPTPRPPSATPSTPAASFPEQPTAAEPSVGLHRPSGADARSAAAGLAVAAARAWLSTQPAALSIDGLDPDPQAAETYVEHLAVESIDHPSRGAAVVTLLALVLPVEGEQYGAPQQVRVAVPVLLDGGGARLSGTPWRLAVHDLSLEPLDGTPVVDPDLELAAAEAVADAGYAQVSLVRLERTDGWPFVAEVDARAPGHDAVARHVLWLRADVGRLVVAGLAMPTEPPAATAEPTEPEPIQETP